MPGTTNMSMGGIVALIGLVVTAVTWIIAPGGYYVLAYGAILVGGLQFLVGLFQFAVSNLKSPRRRARDRAENTVKATLQAMLATSIADGQLQDEEVQTIARIYEQLIGGKLDSKTIKDAARSMLVNEFDIVDALYQGRSRIEVGQEPLILKAAYLVAASDGTIGEDEKKILVRVAIALGMTKDDIAHTLDELQRPSA